MIEILLAFGTFSWMLNLILWVRIKDKSRFALFMYRFIVVGSLLYGIVIALERLKG